MDDAQMAPAHNHIDGYDQKEGLSKFKPGEVVPGVNIGGWHDAGDFDLRIESQAGESYILALAYEAFHPNLDVTSIDQINRVTEIHQPDGKNDLLQQVENGALTVVNGYLALGRLYRGIICNDLRQYVLLGDAAAMTDGKIGNEDDRWIFTEDNPGRELSTAAQLAAVSRVLKGFNDTLSVHCLDIARKVYASTGNGNNRALFPKVQAAVELYLTTGEQPYMDFILDNKELIIKQIGRIGWYTARVEKQFAQMKNKKAKAFSTAFRKALTGYEQELNKQVQETPYGIPYRPHIWGAGWDIQRFGFQHYFPDNRLSGNIPESTGIQCPQLHSRMPPGLQPSFLRLGCRRTISHCGLRTEPRRLVVYSRWSHFRYSSYPSRLPGTPHVPVPLAAN
ncbi:glycoside hydrolase family 9 protein [Bacteroides uniformis]|nr:glycoside hydrolase family 9 protein [Bacteroides uniformis]